MPQLTHHAWGRKQSHGTGVVENPGRKCPSDTEEAVHTQKKLCIFDIFVRIILIRRTLLCRGFLQPRHLELFSAA